MQFLTEADLEPKTRRGKFKLNKKERAWTLYDAGNSAVFMFFILVAVSIGDLAKGTKFAEDPTKTMATFNAISGFAVAIMAPILGAIADNRGRKKPLFLFFVILGVTGAILSLFTNFMVGNRTLFFTCFMICVLMIQTGLGGSIIFYDGMISDITTDVRSDNVSSRGYATGYIYSLIPFSVCLGIYALNMNGSTAQITMAITVCLAISGIWWMFFTLPLLKHYVQVTGVEPAKHQIKDAFIKIGRTLGELRKYKYAFIFLLAFFCYINGVNTVIALSATYAKDVLFTEAFIAANGGYDDANFLLTCCLLGALVMTQVVACIFSIIFGNMSKYAGARNLILISVVGYLVFVIYGVFMHSLVDFFILGFGIGIFQGGIQSLSRSYFARLSPKEKQSEFFGLYDIFNKGANFLGSAMYAGAATLFASTSVNIFGRTLLAPQLSIAVLAIFFVIGLILLFFLPTNKADKIIAE